MVKALAGPRCRDIVVCPQLWDDAHDSDSETDEGCEGGVCMEASLLIIQAAEVETGAAAQHVHLLQCGTLVSCPNLLPVTHIQMRVSR